VLRVQGGHITSWNGDLRMLDHFQMGPSLVRGFAPGGIGPRDLVSGTADALGGSMYWGASAELQSPLFFTPKDYGLKVAVFADAGSLWDYRGPTSWPIAVGGTGETLTVSDDNTIRTSVGAGIVWDSPFGPMRFDYAFPLTQGRFDRVQQFRFGGGTKF
jgi:outer membrane protein insertion porin family